MIYFPIAKAYGHITHFKVKHIALQPRQQTPPFSLITTSGYYKESIPNLDYSGEILVNDASYTSPQTKFKQTAR